MHSRSQKRYRNIIILILVYQILSIIVFAIFAQKTWVLPILVAVMIIVSLIVDGLLMHAYKGSKDADRLERQIAKKYQGEASFTTAQDVFTARMMLQI